MATKHKQAVLACLTQKLTLVNSDTAQRQARELFIYGEGLIVARQTGILSDSMLKSLVEIP